ncbi:iron-sulfur cluster carrier protein [Pseudoclavibacter endophyticus]|uniref:Iron-sulfur cluster carrier protein n=1 Tax=Pseudoclavibacter endophyticus TaxID=1778590 RepID=A0A6H9WFU3_9MICO|nr:P-loop NTPase [Pseudoclavibacter endophyticus]KAB1649772.1 Mrp/NBP35 family ATP-binding protein [Pseudoclavibacter endophyticus]GGA59863.1 iron-sulfur cluster carrier protein [Pseudoclavibacter endophyticus]
MTEPSTRPDGADSSARASILRALDEVIDPEIRRPVTELGMIERVDASDSPDEPAVVELRLTIVGCPAASRIEADVRRAIEHAIGERPYRLDLGVMTPAQRAAMRDSLRGSGPREIPFGPDSLTRVVAVSSGKGGVGKSTVTANLAASMSADGLAVGIVDADVHGYSIPALMGLTGPDAVGDAGTTVPTRLDDMILPPIAHGVKVISIGMFLGEGDGVVAWRGPMLHRTIEQFLRDVYFGDLDVLLVDLPPGTGDIAISLGQLLPGAEVVVVTTPQPSAADVAVRSGLVARKIGQRVIGVIETMSPAEGPDGARLAVFGEGGGRHVAARLSGEDESAPASASTSVSDLEVPLLAEVPLSIPLREAGDAGRPIVLNDPADPAAVALRAAARAIASRPRGLSGRSVGFRVR